MFDDNYDLFKAKCVFFCITGKSVCFILWKQCNLLGSFVDFLINDNLCDWWKCCATDVVYEVNIFIQLFFKVLGNLHVNRQGA